jgi:hypothetical protein
MRPVTPACCGASPSAAIGGLLPYLDHVQLTGPPLQHNPSALLNGWRRVELARGAGGVVDINGASAMVTGGAPGIGAASVRQLAARGARVIVADGITADGTSIGNLPYATACLVVAAVAVYSMSTSASAKQASPATDHTLR